MRAPMMQLQINMTLCAILIFDHIDPMYRGSKWIKIRKKKEFNKYNQYFKLVYMFYQKEF